MDLDSEIFVDGYEHRELAAALATFNDSEQDVFGLNIPVSAADAPAMNVPVDRNAGSIMQFMLYGNPASVHPPSAHFSYFSGSANGWSIFASTLLHHSIPMNPPPQCSQRST
jgi:hypothetical protein